MTGKKGKRPIDNIRDGAGSFDLNTPDDDSEIKEMFSADGRLLIVKENGIYEVKLADQIDPERSNINTPNTVQKVFSFGSKTPWVGKILLTANKLFNTQYLDSFIDCKAAMTGILKLCEDVAALHEVAENFKEDQHKLIDQLNLKVKKDRSILLPTMSNPEARCNEFLQKADHALAELFKIVRLFHPDVRSGGWDSLKSKIKNGPKDIDNFHIFLENALPLLHLVRNARNCVEHPRPEQKIVVTNFSIGKESNMLPPMIEIIHPKTPEQKIPISNFFATILQQLIEVIELMIVFLCARNINPDFGLPLQIIELDEPARSSEHIRYGYGIMSGGGVIPMS